MTLRAFFTFAGVFTAVPALAFLLMFSPPRRNVKWVAVALRLIALSALSSGFRVFVSNITKLDTPLQFANWFDKATAITTVVLSAGATSAFLVMYLYYRLWEDPSD
jgi:hypothetical protein